jgi:hypothetical protein
MDRTGPQTTSNENNRIYFLELGIGLTQPYKTGL